jgi:uncharacterized damage-inducible protein DinB
MDSQTLQLYDYNIWANDRVINHLSGMPEGIVSKEVNFGFKTVLEVICHIVSVDEVWFSRMKEELPEIKAKQFIDIEEVRNYFSKLQSEIQRFIMSIDDRVVTYKNTSGQEFQNSISEVIQHIVNHGTYHRGNITSMLRYQGSEGISTDYIVYLRKK